MGHGIAQVFALAGHDVTITDSHAAESRHGRRRASPPTCAISATTRARSSACGRSPISPNAVRDADYVVEAVLEDMPLKQKLFAEIEKPRPARHHPRQQHLGDADHRDHAGPAAPRARARHALVESAVPGAAGRGDRHAMDLAAGDRLHDEAARRRRQEAGACEEGRAGLHRQPAAARAVARGDLAGRARHLRCRDGRHRDQGGVRPAACRCSARWRMPTWSAPI